MRKLSLIRKYIIVSVLATSVACSVAACSGKKEDNKSTSAPTATGTATTSKVGATKNGLAMDDIVLKVGGENVKYQEMLVYLLQLKNEYEPSLGADIWKYKIDEKQTFEDMAKNELVSQVSKIKIMKQQAKELEVKLDQDEIDTVNKSVKEYMEKITKQDQQKYGITKENVYNVLYDNALAEKVFTVATNDVDTNVSDEQAKQVRFQKIVILTNGEDKNGTQVKLNEKDKVTAKKRADGIRANAIKAEDFKSFATKNSDDSVVEFSMGAGDEPELEKVAFALKVNAVSGVIPTSQGYVILKRMNVADEDATRQKKEEIIEKKRDKIFEEKYKKWSSDYKITQDTARWNKVTFRI